MSQRMSRSADRLALAIASMHRLGLTISPARPEEPCDFRPRQPSAARCRFRRQRNPYDAIVKVSACGPACPAIAGGAVVSDALFGTAFLATMMSWIGIAAISTTNSDPYDTIYRAIGPRESWPP